MLLAALTALACIAAQHMPLVPQAKAWSWPAAGIAFGAGWRWGRRWVLPCAAGAGIALLPDPIPAALATTAVTAGSLAGLTVFRIVEEIDPASDRLRGELQWLTAALGVAAPVQAALVAGVASATLASGSGSALRAWLAAWLAGALGIALLAPLVARIKEPPSAAAQADGHDADGSHAAAPRVRRPWLLGALAMFALAGTHAALLMSGNADDAQTLLIACMPIAAAAALQASGRAFAPVLAAGAAALLAAHAVAAQTAADAGLSSGGQPAAALLCAVLLSAATVARVLRAVALERRSALGRLGQLAEQAAALSALDGPGLVSALQARLAVAHRGGLGLIGIQCDGGPGTAADDSTPLEQSIAAMLARHPESLATARLAADRHVMLIAADSVAQLRATARELYSRLASADVSSGGTLPRACIGALLIEPHAAVDADDCLSALTDAIAIARSVRDPRLFVEPLSQTMIDARRTHRDKIEQVRDAIREARLELFAQPLDDLDRLSDRMEYEILTRLRDRDDSLIAPAEFLPLAAHARLSGALDRAVVQRVFAWLAQHPDARARTGKCAINLSEASIADPTFAAYAREQRLAHGVAAGKIVFEIAEGDVLRDPAAASRLVDELKADGFGIALDDFGRGLATFEYLRRFPLDYLKIDGAFIRNLATSPIDEEIVRSTIRVAQRLSVKTVAEHVHSERVLERLQRLGVDHVQGLLIGAPRPLAELFEPHDANGPAGRPTGQAVPG